MVLSLKVANNSPKEAGHRELVLVADGSYSQHSNLSIMSGAYVATNGRWGFTAYGLEMADSLAGVKTGNFNIRLESGSNAAEFLAVYTGLRALHACGKPLRIVSDSTQTLDFLEAWRRSEKILPRWYNSTPSLSMTGGDWLPLLRQQMYEWPDDLYFEWVKAHDGHAYHTVVDRIANIGRRMLQSHIQGEVTILGARIRAHRDALEWAQRLYYP